MFTSVAVDWVRLALLPTPPRGDALPAATPPENDRRGLDFNQLVARPAGRTRYEALLRNVD